MAMATTKFRWYNVLIISFSHFAHDVYTAFLAPLLPILIKTYSLSYTQAGLLNIIRGVPSLFNPLIGAYVDRIGGRTIIILAPTVSAVAMTLIGITPSYSILAILLFVSGVNSTFYHVPSPVVIKQISGNKSGLGMSFFMLGGESARTLGPIIAMAAVSMWGIEGLWKLIPFGVFSSFMLWWKLKGRKIKGLSPNHDKEKLTNIKIIVKKVYKFFLLMILFLIFRSTVKTALTFFLPTFLKFKGESLWLAGISLSVVELAGMAGTFIGGHVSDKIGRKKTLLIASVITPVSMYFFLESGTVFKFVLLIILGIALFSTGSVLLAFVHDIKTDRPAFVNSLYMVSGFATSAAITFVIGKVADVIGLEQTFYAAAVVSTLAIPVVLMFKEQES
jgi:FSR family fosmidomycin resistance protein-like MFS transporter